MRAEDVSPDSAAAARKAVAASLQRAGETADEARVEIGALLACAYPALAPSILAHPEDLDACRSPGHPRDLRDYERLAAVACGDGSDPARVRRGVRRFATREKLRVAARELLAFPGQDVDVTARELALLAEVCCEVALHEALSWAEARFGFPTTSDGAPCGMVVVGAGKLGGRELNAGSDIDLILFYETDEGSVLPPAPRPAEDRVHTLHEHFTRVAQRMVATIDEATEDGVAWRVDLRLRPEGARGPLTMSLAAAERYYETWGRTWERAALLRARPIAGDLAFGARLMEALSPFVWRRTVDPRVAVDVASMLMQARAEAGAAGVTDLKIGRGGIREVEFFAQGLQLVWGGSVPGVRATNTLDALERLRGRGFVTAREQRELSDAYLLLRRVEHRVHFSTGLQTHAMPGDPDLLERMARSLGYGATRSMLDDLAATRERVHARFASLGPGPVAADDPALQRILASLEAHDEPVTADLVPRFGASAATDLPRHLLALARHPDSPLGAATRDRDPGFAPRLLDALAGAADPEQAARLLAAFFERLVTPGTYVRAMAEEPRRLRALCSLTGASAFLGESLVAHPDLVDQVLYTRSAPTPQGAAAQVALEVESLSAA
ncbi:MAG: bifunctional [glutamate--ammonia ligase]-adenylyl-L-tyrosine phosphorylase/[glutamate--ammonia-ligase] adenylyltransferase, partial [Polyangiaceae bacterium]